MLPNLDQLKQLFRQGVSYSCKNASWFFPPHEKATQHQLELVNKAQNMTEFMSAVNIFNPTIAARFDVPKPVCTNCMLKHTNPQWGEGIHGWYFFVGNYGLTDSPYAYCITFFRSEIAPPEAVKYPNRGDAVGWLIGGGYGNKDEWINIPYEFVQMDYKELSYSTFTLEGKGDKIKSCFLRTTQPMTFEFGLSFTDTKGTSRSIFSTQVSRTPPMEAGKHGFIGFGMPGYGSLYWSYTDMDIQSVIDSKNYTNGKGWMDHQNLKLAGVQGFMPGSTTSAQVLYTVGTTFAKPGVIGWTWNLIQDMESGIQYMISTILPDGYHDNPSTYKPGTVLPKAAICNVYKQGVPMVSPGSCEDLKCVVSKVQVVNGHPYPLEMNFTLPGGKKVVTRAVYGLNLFTNSSGSVSCESPGLLFDENNKPIGYSLLELNGPLTKQEIVQNNLRLAGGDPTNQPVVQDIIDSMNTTQPISRKIVAFIIILLPLFLFIFFVVFIFSRPRSWRKFGFVVVLTLVFQMIFASYMILYGARRQLPVTG